MLSDNKWGLNATGIARQWNRYTSLAHSAERISNQTKFARSTETAEDSTLSIVADVKLHPALKIFLGPLFTYAQNIRLKCIIIVLYYLICIIIQSILYKDVDQKAPKYT